jgi:PAS domain S-box-containing protein
LIFNVVGLVAILGLALLIAMVWQGVASTEEEARREIDETLSRTTERLQILVRAAEMTEESAERTARLPEVTGATLRSTLEMSLSAFEQRPELSYLGIAIPETGEYGCLERAANGQIWLWLFPGTRAQDRVMRSFILSDQGFVLHEERPPNGYDPRARPFYAAALNGPPGGTWMPTYQWIIPSSNSRPVWGFSYVKALRNDSGRLVCVLDTDFDIPALNVFMKSLGAENHCQLQVIELGAKPRLIGDPGVMGSAPLPLPDQLTPLLKFSSETFEGQMKLDGERRWVAARRIDLKGGGSWQVVASRKDTVIEAPLRRQLYQVGGMGLGIVVGLVLVSVQMARRFGQPLAALERRVAHIGQPEPEVAPKPGAASATDEFRETQLLGEALDRAAEAVCEQNLTREQQVASLALKGALFDFTDAALFSLDPQWVILEWNAAAERLFGLERDRAVGQAIKETVLAPDGPADWPAMLAVKGTANYRLRGTRGPFDAEVRIVSFTQSGREVRTIIILDISARKNAELRLRRERDYADAVLNSLPGVFYHVDRDLHLVRWNKNFERISGYGADELAGIHPLNFFVEEEKALVASKIGEVFEKGEAHVEADYLLKDGRRIPYLFTGVRFEHEGRLGYVGVGTDIAERKRMEEDLRKETAMFEAQVESALDGILVVDRHGKKIIQNQRLNELWKIPPEIVANPDNGPQIQFALQKIKNPTESAARVAWLDAHPEETIHDEIELLDGTILERYSAPVHDKNRRYYGRIWAFRDITAHRRAEQQKAALEAQLRQTQKLEALGTLAGGIAHDFNNILTAIIGNQELALMELDAPEDLRRSLDGIGQASKRAKELVRQILTFSRKQQPERKPQSLQPIVAEVLGLLRASLPVTIEICPDLSLDAPIVLADGNQIHQVAMNLCTNAAHAMRGRPGRLSVRLARRLLDAAASQALPELRPGRYALLTISDTGCGMSAEVLARIFEPFFTTKGPGEGTGLGLAVVHGIMKDHDGAIAVRSQPGVGTTFELYFPEAVEADVAVREADTGILPGRGECILVVDDEEAICAVIGAMLEKIGYRAETFDDPRAALERLRAAPAAFDLLLTDRTMPHLSGPELVAQVHIVRPNIPAFMMSGLSDEDPAAGQEYGLVAKPIDIANLSHILRHALDATR